MSEKEKGITRREFITLATGLTAFTLGLGAGLSLPDNSYEVTTLSAFEKLTLDELLNYSKELGIDPKVLDDANTQEVIGKVFFDEEVLPRVLSAVTTERVWNLEPGDFRNSMQMMMYSNDNIVIEPGDADVTPPEPINQSHFIFATTACTDGGVNLANTYLIIVPHSEFQPKHASYMTGAGYSKLEAAWRSHDNEDFLEIFDEFQKVVRWVEYDPNLPDFDLTPGTPYPTPTRTPLEPNV